MEIAPATRMGLVELSVADIGRTVEYWQRAIGLRVLGREDGAATSARTSRCSASWMTRARSPTPVTPASTTSRCWSPTGRALPASSPTPPASGCRSTGLSDHDVSEAIYLRDPDGHGIEVYADRPREAGRGRSPSG